MEFIIKSILKQELDSYQEFIKNNPCENEVLHVLSKGLTNPELLIVHQKNKRKKKK